TCKSMGSVLRFERGTGRQRVLGAPAGDSRTARFQALTAIHAISPATVWGGLSRPGTPLESLRTPLNSLAISQQLVLQSLRQHLSL
ncbi:MAG: hypothetical protein ACYTXY_44005, partial [Nostoc sp.]